jgi:hypothetical protein
MTGGNIDQLAIMRFLAVLDRRSLKVRNVRAFAKTELCPKLALRVIAVPASNSLANSGSRHFLPSRFLKRAADINRGSDIRRSLIFQLVAKFQGFDCLKRGQAETLSDKPDNKLTVIALISRIPQGRIRNAVGQRWKFLNISNGAYIACWTF